VQTPEDAPARSAEEEGMGQSNQIMRAVSFAHEGWATVLVDQTPAQREKHGKTEKQQCDGLTVPTLGNVDFE